MHLFLSPMQYETKINTLWPWSQGPLHGLQVFPVGTIYGELIVPLHSAQALREVPLRSEDGRGNGHISLVIIC